MLPAVVLVLLALALPVAACFPRQMRMVNQAPGAAVHATVLATFAQVHFTPKVVPHIVVVWACRDTRVVISFMSALTMV